ncbi:MAG: V-type ATP synthase subunit E [Clostridia bacterium]|nr:V-type ATP synthase subunit E [Clostridia bacterium]
MSEKAIIDTIINDAALAADDIINKAKISANEKISREKSEIEKRTAKSKIASDTKAQQLIESAYPAGEIIVRNAVLKEKHRIIDNTINDIFNNLKALQTENYFALIKQVIVKNKQDKNGEIQFNSLDLKRMPKDFDKQFKDLTVCREPVKISGGVILKYDNIFIDLSFEGIKNDKYDDLVDLLNKELFKKD